MSCWISAAPTTSPQPSHVRPVLTHDQIRKPTRRGNSPVLTRRFVRSSLRVFQAVDSYRRGGFPQGFVAFAPSRDLWSAFSVLDGTARGRALAPGKFGTTSKAVVGSPHYEDLHFL